MVKNNIFTKQNHMKTIMAGFNLWGARQTLSQALHQNVHMDAFLVSPRQTFLKTTETLLDKHN